MKNTTAKLCLLPAAFLLASSLAQAQTSIIPQIVDGGPWQTAIVITNTGATQSVVSLTFFQDAGGGATSSWNLAFKENVQASALIVQGGSTTILHTSQPPGTTVGWGKLNQLDNTGTVVAYAIFTQQAAVLGIGTAPASATVSRILVPFDNTNGAATSMAIANSTGSSETINVGLRIGGVTSQPTAITLPANGHLAFAFSQQFSATANQSGLAEFYSPSGSFGILALKFVSGALTTSPVYSATGPPLIASSSSGGGGSTSGNITFAGFTVGRLNKNSGSFPTSGTVTEIAQGQFASYTPAEWNLPFSAQMIGSCGVLDVTYSSTTNAPYAPDTYLDAGTIALSGAGVPSGATLQKISTPAGPIYAYNPPSGTLQLGQAYTISSNGGPQVNAFNATAAALPSSFAVTNWDSITSINRAAGLTLNWTGSGFDQVIIAISATNITGTSLDNASVHAVTISCAVPASGGTFAIPQEALAKLPAVQSGSPLSSAVMSVTVGTTADGQITGVSTTSKSFTPTLVSTGAPIDYGSFTSFLAVTKSLSII